MANNRYIAENIDYSRDASFINADGSKTLISTMVPQETDGGTYDFDINQYHDYDDGYGFMNLMTSGDINGDGSDDIIFSDHTGNLAAIPCEPRMLSMGVTL